MFQGPHARRIRLRPILAVLALALALAEIAVAPPAVAATSIEVVVNGTPITSYDIDQRTKLLRLTVKGANLRQAAIDELIQETLQLEEAKRVGIAANQAEVDRAMADIATRVKLSPAQFNKALGSQGVSPETLRERLMAQITWSKVIRARFEADSTVSEQDLVAALLKKGEGTEKETTQFDLREVTIALPSKPSAQRLQSAQQRARSLRDSFTSCREGTELARKTRETVIRTLGTRIAEDLPPALVENLEALPVGRLSEPNQTGRGLVMYAVCDKKTIKSSLVAMQSLEPEVREEKGGVMARQYLRTLRRNAIIEHR